MNNPFAKAVNKQIIKFSILIFQTEEIHLKNFHGLPRSIIFIGKFC